MLLNFNHLSTLNDTLSLKLTEFILSSSTEHHTRKRTLLPHIPFFDVFSVVLESAAFCSRHLLITGDFNIHMDVASDADAIRLCGLLESIGLKQQVTVPTHISGHTLDLVITRFSDHLGISTPWTDYLFSDHMPAYSKLQVYKPASRNRK